MQSPSVETPRRRRTPTAVRWVSVPVVVVVLLAGIWVAGGLITNDFKVSMLLTVAWGALAGLACFVLVLKRREMWPALAAYLVTAAAAGIYLGTQTLIDRKVDEKVVTGRAGDRAAGRARHSQRTRRARRQPAPLARRVRVARTRHEWDRSGDRGRRWPARGHADPLRDERRP
ncbi:MAG TPA: hypothetical protein VF752_14340 [Thermoleophilaceae bacterium]